jgi:hypothetical protein
MLAGEASSPWRHLNGWVGITVFPALLWVSLALVGTHGYYVDLAAKPTYTAAWLVLALSVAHRARGIAAVAGTSRWVVACSALLGIGPEIVLSAPIAAYDLGYIVGSVEWFDAVIKLVHWLQLPGIALSALVGVSVDRWSRGLTDPFTTETLVPLIVLNVMNFAAWFGILWVAQKAVKSQKERANRVA